MRINNKDGKNRYDDEVFYIFSMRKRRHPFDLRKDARLDHDGVLNHCDIFCRRAFRSLLDVKGYPVTIVEGFKAVSVDH